MTLPLRLHRTWPVLPVVVTACASMPDPDVPHHDEIQLDDGVLFRSSVDLPTQQPAGLWPGTWRVLSQSPGGRSSLHLTLEAGAGSDSAGYFASDIELFVHRGLVRIGQHELGFRDYARIPAGAVIGDLHAVENSEVLFYSTGDRTWTPTDRSPDPAAIEVARYETLPWKGGEVSREAGEDIPLRIKHYRNDPVTGARTFIVASGPDAEVPWERHSMVEEGFLIEGDYQLAECLPEGKAVGNYQVGGYFYRPPGIVHSGPDSFTRRGAMWLIRTPAALDVEFFTEC